MEAADENTTRSEDKTTMPPRLSEKQYGNPHRNKIIGKSKLKDDAKANIIVRSINTTIVV